MKKQATAVSYCIKVKLKKKFNQKLVKGKIVVDFFKTPK